MPRMKSSRLSSIRGGLATPAGGTTPLRNSLSLLRLVLVRMDDVWTLLASPRLAFVQILLITGASLAGVLLVQAADSVIILGSAWAATASLVTFLLYAGYLHARVFRGWHGTRRAALLMLGFGAVVFTYFRNLILQRTTQQIRVVRPDHGHSGIG